MLRPEISNEVCMKPSPIHTHSPLGVDSREENHDFWDPEGAPGSLVLSTDTVLQCKVKQRKGHRGQTISTDPIGQKMAKYARVSSHPG